MFSYTITKNKKVLCTLEIAAQTVGLGLKRLRKKFEGQGLGIFPTP